MPELYHANQLPLFDEAAKECNICHVKKPLEEFYKESRNPDGHRKECIDCRYIREGKDPATRKPRVLLPVGISEKTCNRCGDKKSIEDFPKNPSSGDGYKSICKVCNAAAVKAHREANPEQHKERAHASYVRTIETKRKYRRENADSINTYWRNRRANDPTFHQTMREYHSQYAASNREQMNRYASKWREANPLKNTEYAMRYKARKQAVTVEQVDYELIFQACDGICYICEKQILPHHDIEFDHIIPITRQGPHSYENIAVVHDICNSRKHNKLLEELTPFQRRGPSS